VPNSKETANLEFADALEFHGFTGEVLARRHRVGEDVQQERSAARRVHSERHHVAHHRLSHEFNLITYGLRCKGIEYLCIIANLTYM
jgi:hypothetical protein